MILHFAVLVVAFVLMSFLPGVRLKGVATAVVSALVFVLANFFLGWLVKTVLVLGTLGLALLALNFLANLVLLWITDKVIENFEIKGFVPLLLCTVILTVANTLGAHHHRILGL